MTARADGARSGSRPRVIVNASGLRAGGGSALVHAVLDELAEGGDRGLDWVFIVARQVIDEHESAHALPVRLVPQHRAPLRRIVWEQLALARPAPGGAPEVLVSGGNFGPLARREAHVLLALNRLHFERPAVRARKGLRLRVESALARASVRRAGLTVTPSCDMARAVEARTGRRSTVLAFGPGLVKRHVPAPAGRFTFALRTPWGPHKRLADLLLAVRELALTDAGRFVVVSSCDPGTRFARRFRESERDRALLRDPLVSDHVRFETFGPARQTTLECDAVVVPGTTESFSIPLAEATGVGVPVVAADTSFAREICGPSAFFVPPGDHRALAGAMRRAIHGERPPPPPADVRARLSWPAYVDGLAEICRAVAAGTAPPA